MHVEGSNQLCGVDWAEKRGVRDEARFRYAAQLSGGTVLPVSVRDGAVVCVTLPHVAPDGGTPDDAPERYVGVAVTDGVARGTLLAHLYDLGPARGYRLAGIERPEP